MATIAELEAAVAALDRAGAEQAAARERVAELMPDPELAKELAVRSFRSSAGESVERLVEGPSRGRPLSQP